jgi:hypothetical protein
MRSRHRSALLALALAATTAPATAGLLNDPAPALGEGTARVVYRMGAVHFEPGGWVNTTVTCTNLGPASTIIALEIFDERDERAGSLAQATVPAGAAVTFATSADAAPGAIAVPGLPAIDHGKARVIASSTQLACTAVNRMRGADGAVKEAPLELIKKVAF